MPIAVLTVATGGAAVVSAQAPARETVTAVVNGKKLSIEYGRPALGGRSVKELLAQLPANRIWRAGVNDATTLTTESDVVIGGKRVPAGKYTLYLYAPESAPYELIVNRDLGVPARDGRLWPHYSDYETIKDKEVVHIPLKSVTPAEPMDRFLIGLGPAKAGPPASSLTLTWGDQSWTADITPPGK
jgi:hypothetical protein